MTVSPAAFEAIIVIYFQLSEISTLLTSDWVNLVPKWLIEIGVHFTLQEIIPGFPRMNWPRTCVPDMLAEYSSHVDHESREKFLKAFPSDIYIF